MPEKNDDRLRRSVAFVTHTREYRAADVLPALARQGYITTERPHDRDTERLLIQLAPDLVLLAVDPRQETDLTVIGNVARSSRASIVVIAPGPHVNGMSSALDAGADVCLRDTDGPELLTAQLSAIARRKSPGTSFDAFEGGPASIQVRDLELDFDRCQASRGDDLIPLTPTEFKILAYLARNAGKVISPVEILRAVQDYTYSEREAQEIVKVYIRRIRRKIEFDPSEPNYIVNIRGFGYMLERRGIVRGESGADTRAA
ncbi:MAG: DNA-binding response regulator [Dehalococcoidia bacterium]